MQIDHFIDRLHEEFDEVEPGTIKPESNFKDFNDWSSIYALILVAMVENEYGVELTIEDLRKVETVQDLFALVKSRK